MFDEDFFQWLVISVLLLVSITTCTLAVSNAKMGKDFHQMKGKVDLLSQTYIDVFRKMHENLSAAMEKDS